MSRMYIVNHWNDAATYSGEQIGDRLKDSTALHFNRDGSANTQLYSEETALAKKKTSVPLKQRILPQASRVDKLRSEAIELEAAFKAGEFSAEEYTLLREVAFNKLRRAEVLYKKAISVKAPSYDDDEYHPDDHNPSQDTAQTWEETYKVSGVYASENGDHVEGESVSWVDDLSPTNSLKKPLKIACTLIKTAVHLSHKARSYWNELKAV